MQKLYIKRLLLVSTFAVLLTACQVMVQYHQMPFNELLPGSKLVLTQKAVIPSGLAAFYLQDGEVILENNIRVRQPHCKFEVNTLSEIPQTIRPDEFEITRFFIDTDYVMSEKIFFAGIGIGGGIGGGSDGGPIAEIYTIQMYLYSQRQPDVLRVSCLHWEDPQDGQHLTFEQVKQAVGGIIQFKAP